MSGAVTNAGWFQPVMVSQLLYVAATQEQPLADSQIDGTLSTKPAEIGFILPDTL
jgi:hypothetical protein